MLTPGNATAVELSQSVVLYQDLEWACSYCKSAMFPKCFSDHICKWIVIQGHVTKDEEKLSSCFMKAT